MNRRTNVSDGGNAALEVLVVALLGSVLTVGFALNAFQAQKAAFAAAQLARQVVRLESLGLASDAAVARVREVAARNLHLQHDDVQVILWTEDNAVVAKASVRGQSSVAKMRLAAK